MIPLRYSNLGSRVCSLLVVLTVLLILAACEKYSTLLPGTSPRAHIRPAPKMNVYIMPRSPVKLYHKNVAMIPAFMEGKQEQEVGASITRLIQSLLLQERLFKTLYLYQDNNIPLKEQLIRAQNQGFDYLLVIEIPSIIEPSGDSPGWVGVNMDLVSTSRGFSLWKIYGESQLIPQPTRYGLIKRDQFVSAPSIDQGIVAIVREASRIMRGQDYPTIQP